MTSARLRAIPSVEKVLLALGDVELPRAAAVAVVRRELAGFRSKNQKKAIPDFDGVVSGVRRALDALSASRIRPVLNATGIIVHTNFGRAPLASAAIIAAVAADVAAALIRPADDHLLEACPVSPAVNRVANDSPALIAPAAAEPAPAAAPERSAPAALAKRKKAKEPDDQASLF